MVEEAIWFKNGKNFEVRLPERVFCSDFIGNEMLKARKICALSGNGCLVIQGVLPEGKCLVLEARGQPVKVTFFGGPMETRW